MTIKGVSGQIAEPAGHNQITPTFVSVRVGMRVKETPHYTVSQGWSESFSFDLTYHEHLFWNLQVILLRLLVHFIIFRLMSIMSKHCGRVLMPAVMKFEFRKSPSATRQVHNWKSSNIYFEAFFANYSALRRYDLRSKNCPPISFRILGLKTATEEQMKEGDASCYPVLGSVDMIIQYEHLTTKLEVARSSDTPVLFDSALLAPNSRLKYIDDLEQIMVDSFSTTTASDHASSSSSIHIKDPNVLKEKIYSEQRVTWLDTISRMVMSEQDQQSIRELKFIASGFGQGLDISPFSLGVALILLQRFYDTQPQIFTNNLVITKEYLDLPRVLYKYTLASLGLYGLNFFGKGRGLWKEYWRDQANYRSILDYLSIPESDLLVFNLEEDKVFRPGFFVCIDRSLSAVILSIRGTMCARDAMTDLICEYVPYKSGIIHSGFLKSSLWFFENIGRQLLMFAEEYGLENIYCVGHSLGGATASLTCMHIYDYFNEREEGWPMCTFDPQKRINLHCYAYGSPPTVSQSIASKYDDVIDVFINGEDVVPTLSFGSVWDMHLMVCYAASIASASHLFGAIESSPVMDRLQHCRKQIVGHSNRINPKLFIIGKLHHIVSLEAPNNERYRVVETVGPERFQEIKFSSKALRHHMPDRYEAAMDEAYATFLKLEREERIKLADDAMKQKPSGL